MTREEHIYQLKQYLQGKLISMCPSSSLYWQEHWEEVIKALEQEPTNTIDYRRAFKIACDLLNGNILYGVDTDKIYELMMKKDEVVSSSSYEEYILNHLQDLDQGQYANEPTTKNDLGVDCIDRNKAYEIIENWAEAFDVGTYFDNEQVKEIIMACANRIDELPSVIPQEPRWIPVSDYLPETNDEVLVTYIVNGNHKKRYVETASCFDGEWSSVNDEYRTPNTKIEIIAWCEMPKPYREVEE